MAPITIRLPRCAFEELSSAWAGSASTSSAAFTRAPAAIAMSLAWETASAAASLPGTCPMRVGAVSVSDTFASARREPPP
jgi:hypothetical protein